MGSIWKVNLHVSIQSVRKTVSMEQELLEGDKKDFLTKHMLGCEGKHLSLNLK